MTYKLKGTCVPVEYLVMGPIENNVYLVGEDEACFVVDPTCQPSRIVNALDGRTPQAIVLTHAHWDHVGAARDLREATGAPVIASAVDAPYIDGSKQLDSSHRRFDPCPIDRVLSDGDTVEIGGVPWTAIATPGHTPGSMCLFLEAHLGSNPEGAPVLVAGDTLFAGAHGRTDFAGGSPAAMSKSLKRLAMLPSDTVVLPGHNAMTTIGREAGWMRRGGLGR